MNTNAVWRWEYVIVPNTYVFFYGMGVVILVVKKTESERFLNSEPTNMLLYLQLSFFLSFGVVNKNQK